MTQVVLFSGGLDSSTALAMASKRNDHVLAVSVRYGAVHQVSEIAASVAIAAHYGVEHRIITFPPNIFTGGDSALLGEAPIPTEEYHDPTKESPSATIVPFRNANLISMATAIAEAAGGGSVWVATHATDAGGWAYLDCSPEFIGAMTAAVYIGTLRKVNLIAPFNNMTKAQIVEAGMKLHVPFHLTWSCYRGWSLHCGTCPTCRERHKAFVEANYSDPTIYQTDLEL